MKLYSLLKNVKCRVFGNINLNISGLYHKDTEVKENGLFFCVRGIRVDGTKFVSSAIKNGAVAVVSEQEISGLTNVTQIIVKNVRETMSLIACKFYGEPAEKLKIIGVTGTNGKTSITYILAESLNNLGKKCAIIGTNGVIIGNEKIETSLTTPDPLELQKLLSMVVKKKIEYVCMEISAHAIDLYKIEGIKFNQIIFTNLTQDHLDYFKTIDNYFETKAKVFNKKYTNFAVINIDDEYGKKIIERIKIPYLTYAIVNSDAKIIASKIEQNLSGLNFLVEGNKLSVPLYGRFNVYNVLAVIIALRHLDFNNKEIFNSLLNTKIVEGRFNLYNVQNKKVIIDYAHTPDGLINILKSSRELAGDKKVICVFGCGGNRDTKKRPIMGEIASKYADWTFLTSDNPRFEDKMKIIKDIETGIKNTNSYSIFISRSDAISNAINFAKEGDVVVIAGKGSEKYIDENGKKIPYSDKGEVEKYLK